MIIGLAGRAGSGKSTVARMLCEMVPGAREIAFAGPLKAIVGEVYGWPDEVLNGPSELRNRPDPRYVRLDRAACEKILRDVEQGERMLRGLAHRHSDEAISDAALLQFTGGLTAEEFADLRETGVVHLTPRFALQRLGTEWGRACCEDTWAALGVDVARQLLARPTSVPLVVISDVRFPNEARLIRDAGGFVLRIDRRQANEREALHESERHFILADVTIDNDKSIDELPTALKRALEVFGFAHRLMP